MFNIFFFLNNQDVLSFWFNYFFFINYCGISAFFKHDPIFSEAQKQLNKLA